MAILMVPLPWRQKFLFKALLIVAHQVKSMYMAWTTGVMHFSAITNKMDAACKEQMYSYNSLESNGKKKKNNNNNNK